MWRPWLIGMLILAVSVLGGLVVHGLFYSLLSRFQREKGERKLSASWIRHTRRPVLYLLLLIIAGPLVHTLPLNEEIIHVIQHGFLLTIIGVTAWLLVNLLETIRELVVARYRTDMEDNLAARRIQTQMTVLNRVLQGLVMILAVALMIMTFPGVWSLGAGILASAGAAGLILGIAAKGVLQNLLAGLQIALMQPIRIDDVVVVQGEWGRVEEIGSAYVIIRVWDLRRLVVPLNYFIEQSFQNWTRNSSNLLGTVLLYVDYTVPVEEVRQELKRLLESNPLWDKNAWALQVTDAQVQVLELRALVSARNSGHLFDLRCQIREQLIAFLTQKYPAALPKSRSEAPQPSIATKGAPLGP